MNLDVIFEKHIGETWTPVPSTNLQPGDTIRMKTLDGTVLPDSECRVAGKNSTDPDSRHRYDLCLEPLGG